MRSKIMKLTTTLAVLGLCTTGLFSAANAQGPNPSSRTYVDQNGAIVVLPPYEVRNSEIPTPTTTIPLNVGPEYAGQQVDMLFMVDKSGRAYNIDADTSNMPDRYTNVKTASLVTQLAVNIGGWQFEPARDSAGNPVERMVRLPINLGG
jgi:hypothetical protein